MKKIIVLSLFILFQMSFSQNSSRIFQKITHQKNSTEIMVTDGVYKIKFYTPEIVETAFIPTGQTLKTESHAVILQPADVRQNFSENEGFAEIKTDGISVKIQKKPFQISYFEGGKILISEKNGYGTYKNGEINGHPQDFETLNFALSPDEVLYGGGARAIGMNHRGKRLTLYNKAQYGYSDYAELLNYTMPIVVSDKKYLLHFDNAPAGYLDLDSKKDNSLTYETISGRKVYQVVGGKTWEDLVKNYTALTGRQPMIPRWSLGNFSSRFGYHTQKQVLETVQKFKDEKIPVDAVVVDLYWFGKPIQGTLGNFEFDKDNFASPQQMVDLLRKENVETVLITEPFVLKTSSHWKEAVEKKILAKKPDGNPYEFDFYFGHGGLIDIYNPEGYQWFKNIYKNLLNMKIAGIWGDLGEPEAHPSQLLHATGTADQVHNTYGSDWAKLVYNSFKEYTSLRPFILMRAGYSGAQRYGIIPWTGDVSRSWGGLKNQPEISLQMGLQGIAYMNSDLGGFAGDQIDDELYTRWLQYGIFQPIYRPHAGEAVPSEPVFRTEKIKNLAKKAIELRYAMLPYNYDLAYRNHKTGSPLMKPLFFTEPENKQLSTYSAAYLWGDDFLVSPVVKQGNKEQEVYFPKNSNWFNFYTGEKFSGGTYKKITLTENNIPTFVKGGAIIPLAKPMQNTKEYDANSLEIHYYTDPTVIKSEKEIYNDDGETVNAEEKGKFEKTIFEARQYGKNLKFSFKNKLGKNYKAPEKHFDLILHNFTKPHKVRIDGRKIKNISFENEIVKIPIVWNSSRETTIEISR